MDLRRLFSLGLTLSSSAVHGFSPRRNAMSSTPRALRLMKAQAEPLKDALAASRQNKGTMDRIKFKAKNASATAIVETEPLRRRSEIRGETKG